MVNNNLRLIGLGLLSVAVLLCGVSASAVTISAPVRGASGYGPQTSLGSCNGNIADFQADPSNQANCIGVNLTTFDVNGTQLSGAQYSFLSNSGDFGKFDVFDIGGVTSGSTFFVPLLDPNALTGVFFCNNGSNSTAQDSFLTSITGLPCTPGAPNSANVTETILPNGIQFNFTADFSDITLFTADGNLVGNTTATPEPGTIALLGTGVLALWGKFRRRQSA